MYTNDENSPQNRQNNKKLKDLDKSTEKEKRKDEKNLE